MSKRLLLLAALCSISPHSLANDLMPGTWETTTTFIDEERDEEDYISGTEKHCVDLTFSENIATYFRDGFSQTPECNDTNVSRSGKKIETHSSCEDGYSGDIFERDMEITIHNKTHYTINSTETSPNRTPLKSTSESHWISIECDFKN